MEIKIFYFNIEHAIKLHDWIINNSGGLPGNREIGLLDSALQHIQNDMYYPTFEEKLKHLVYAVNKFHPFNDGNGRISRIMMNSELVAADQSKIIIPTVFREDYLNALRRLTRKGDPSVVIRALSRVRQFSANITGDNFEVTRKYLESCNAFKDGDGYILRF
mgnify:CR=1 FL=1